MLYTKFGKLIYIYIHTYTYEANFKQIQRTNKEDSKAYIIRRIRRTKREMNEVMEETMRASNANG